MKIIECIKSGIIYRNPIPHIKSINAYFPSVVQLENNEMIAAFSLGEAFEAENLRTYTASSKDGGETWSLQGTIYPGTLDVPTSDCCRINISNDGEIVAFMVRHNRSRIEQGLANPDNLGFVETELLLMKSKDNGNSWSNPQAFEPPLIGPSFELCCPIVFLSDGRWIIPTSTWKGWDGFCPNGMKMVAFVSHDKGATWPEYMDVMSDPEGEMIYWESKILEMKDGRLLAVSWGYNSATGKDTTNQFAISSDGGKTFSNPASTGLFGQTLTPFLLEDGRIFTVYRRMDKEGLWANISRIESGMWVNEYEEKLWGNITSKPVFATENMVENFNILRFGAPYILKTSDGLLYLAFWCVEDCVSNIRWMKLKIN